MKWYITLSLGNNLDTFTQLTPENMIPTGASNMFIKKAEENIKQNTK